jgi:hypothetical protein
MTGGRLHGSFMQSKYPQLRRPPQSHAKSMGFAGTNSSVEPNTGATWKRKASSVWKAEP